LQIVGAVLSPQLVPLSQLLLGRLLETGAGQTPGWETVPRMSNQMQIHREQKVERRFSWQARLERLRVVQIALCTQLFPAGTWPRGVPSSVAVLTEEVEGLLVFFGATPEDWLLAREQRARCELTLGRLSALQRSTDSVHSMRKYSSHSPEDLRRRPACWCG
jgi:hypothetical protein